MSSLAFAYVEVPVKNLLKVINPFEKPPWYCRSFTKDEVWQAIEEGRFQAKPVPNWWSVEDQIERIAFLVVEGWDEENDLPEIFMDEQDWPLGDGNHRLCAAAVRGDETLKVIINGDLDAAEKLFEFKIPEHLRMCED